jgi:DNA-binding NarL/FixJ family response regulator
MPDWIKQLLSKPNSNKQPSQPGPAELRKDPSPLTGLLETLELLHQQASRYEQALPPTDYPARAAVTVLGRLAQQALGEAHDLAQMLEQEPIPEHPSVPHSLSPREFEVLTLAAQGLTNKEIAYRLRLSERTVQFHMNSIFNKTSTNSRTEAVALAIRLNWLS